MRKVQQKNFISFRFSYWINPHHFFLFMLQIDLYNKGRILAILWSCMQQNEPARWNNVVSWKSNIFSIVSPVQYTRICNYSQATTNHLSSSSQQDRFTRGFEAEGACVAAAWEAICLWISKCSSGAWYNWKQMLQ